MNSPMIRAAICIFAIPLLAACQDDPAPAIVGEDSRDATGDVLGGSISDDMLPLESLQSTSPAAQETAAPASGAPSRPTAAAEPAAPESAESEPAPTVASEQPDAEAE